MKFELKAKQILMFLLLTTGWFSGARAQSNMVFYSLEEHFNSASFNPAFLTSKNRFTFSIFPLAGTNIGYNNREEVKTMVDKLLSGANKADDYVNLAKKVVGRPSVNQKLESEWLTFTYRSKAGFLNFRIVENVSVAATISGPVSKFMVLPEVKSIAIGQTQKIPVLLMHYREYSLGYSMPPGNRRISAGIRAKLYFGKSAFSSEISGSVGGQSGKYFLKTWGNGNISVPQENIVNDDGTTSTVPGISPSAVKSYILNSGNTGVGVDLGIRYKITPDLTGSLSVIDLGKINWKNNLNSKNFEGEYNFELSGIDPQMENGIETIGKTADSISFANTISKPFELTNVQTPFSTSLPVTIYAGLNYRLSPSVKLNLTDRYIRLKNLNHHSLSVTASFELNKKLTVNTGYSIIGNSYSNIPAAVFLDRDFGQIYLGTDNLLSLLLPSGSEFSGLTFGTCFYLFRKRDLYGSPTERFPFHKPKKVKKATGSGRILKEYPEF